jgi:rod shape determining protein RodA
MFDRRLLANFDWVFFGLVLVISLTGIMAIYSASEGFAQGSTLWLRQLNWLGIGLAVGFLVLLVDFRTIGNWAYVLHGLGCMSLVLLLFYGSGSAGSPVERWFVIGPVAVQPSEFIKLTTILSVAYYFRDTRRTLGLGWRGMLVPLLLVLVPFALIVRQPDLGTAVILLAVLFPMLVLGGLRMRVVAYLGAAGFVAIMLLIGAFHFGFYELTRETALVLHKQGVESRAVQADGERYHLRSSFHAALASQMGPITDEAAIDAVDKASFKPYISLLLRPYQQRRLITFINPDKDPLGAGYHVIQSKVAIGSGGFWGKGFGNSTQGSLNFLPARHTDFIFSIFSEEWGFVGAFGLLALYGLLIGRGMSIVLQTQDRFGAFLTMGVTALITIQALTNIAMAIGMLPVVGVPLPFFSYGGSSMLSLMIGVALILNIRMRRFLWV